MQLRAHTISTPMYQQHAQFNPLDINAGQAAAVQDTNRTINALRNSGLGPSTGATILAADAQGSANAGNTFLRDWNANNTLRNNVIAMNNQSDAMRAQHQVGVDQFNAGQYTNADRYNAYADMQKQMQHIQDDARLAQALSASMNLINKTNMDTARENMYFNMANTNPMFYHDMDPRGVITKRANEAKCGGTLLKRYKK